MADSKPSKPSDPPKDTGYYPGDDVFTICKNMFSYMTGKMTPEGQELFREASEIRNEARDCNWCEDKRDYFLKYSPVIRFMQDNIRQLGGNIDAHNIHCRRCTDRMGGGLDPEYGIKICANHMLGEDHLEDTMTHEMIHAYDHLRFKADLTDNLRHAACTEIRASSLSGECRWKREFFGRNQWKFAQHHQECVRRRAVLSVSARPTCIDEDHARRVVDEVWESCFRDTRPFDEIYR